ncbi:MAG: hypothetical protein HQ596_06810 [Candidatus Saganbacteria bacterium]|nr:hypothetical protein [Candidatus Saganbacteria bacterium]
MSRTKKILDGIVKSDRVASAYLFVGPPGPFKKEAAEDFCDQLGCKKQDRFLLSPSGTSLKIDQIRELQTAVRYGPSASRYLVAIVYGADNLTDQAAAAFLKTLEEPAPGVVFILLAEKRDKLLPTILSRCQKIVFPEESGEWEMGQANPFYMDLKDIKKTKPLELSRKIEKEKKKIDELLYDLVHFARYELRDVSSARIILDTLRYIKRRANLKLALDVMCLRLARQ